MLAMQPRATTVRGVVVVAAFGRRTITPIVRSPRAHLHVVGDVAVYVFDMNHLSLPTTFYSVLVPISVFMAISTVFHSINSPDNSPFSDCASGLISA